MSVETKYFRNREKRTDYRVTIVRLRSRRKWRRRWRHA